ncbi:MAG TPA: CBS domain-containing protein [Gemmataceae bacterium]|jgi:magnesium transporter
MIRQSDADRLGAYLDTLPAAEFARAVSRLTDPDRGQLLALLPPRRAADLIEGLPAAQAAALLELLPPERAADILAAVYSDERADVLAELDEDRREAVLAVMPPATADEARRLIRHPADTVGGMMVTEYLSYRDAARVSDVFEDLRAHADAYSRYNVRYAHVTAAAGELAGVLRLRDLLLTPPDTPVRSVMRPDPRRVWADTPLDDLLSFFGRHPYFGAPVTDRSGRLVGVVRRADVEEAAGDRAGRTLLRLTGVIGGKSSGRCPWPPASCAACRGWGHRGAQPGRRPPSSACTKRRSRRRSPWPCSYPSSRPERQLGEPAGWGRRRPAPAPPGPPG